MPYKKDIVWHKINLSEEETKGIRTIMQDAFKRGGGKGDLPKSGLGVRDLLKGSYIVDVELTKAGNIQEAPAQIMAKPLSRLAEPANNGVQDTGLAEKLATIEKALAMLLTQGSAPSHASSAMLAPAKKNTKARKAA